MKMAFAIATFAISSSAFATNAVIKTNDGDGNPTTIELDAKGKPRENGSAKTYPTIKDFRDGSDYLGFCVQGADRDVRSLLTALVSAADGDGDSWAELT